MKKYEPAHLVPRYDANGFDSGLYVLYVGDFTIYDNLTLFIRGNKLIVGQYPDWDDESYDDEGCILADHVKLGEFVCPNPYQDDDAAAYLGELFKGTKAESY